MEGVTVHVRQLIRLPVFGTSPDTVYGDQILQIIEDSLFLFPYLG